MAEGGGGAVTAVEKQKPHAPSANGPWTLSDQDPSNLPPHTLQSSLVLLPCGPIWAVLGDQGGAGRCPFLLLPLGHFPPGGSRADPSWGGSL